MFLFLSASSSTSYIRQHILSDEYYLMPHSLGKINRLIKKQARPSLISPNKMQCVKYIQIPQILKKRKKVLLVGIIQATIPDGVVPTSCCRIKQRCCIRKVELLNEGTARVCLSNLMTHWTGDTMLCPWVYVTVQVKEPRCKVNPRDTSKLCELESVSAFQAVSVLTCKMG